MWCVRRITQGFGHFHVVSLSDGPSRLLTTFSKPALSKSRVATSGSCFCHNQYRFLARPSIAKAKSNTSVLKEKAIIKNDEISKDYSKIRVVYKNESTGGDDHKIVSRLEALNMAKSMSLDLILVSGNSNPPVCRIADSGI